MDTVRSLESVISVEECLSLHEIYGKRIIIIGGGAQVAMVAQGAITESIVITSERTY